MAQKITKSALLAAALASGLSLGTVGLAVSTPIAQAARDCPSPFPSYPPRPGGEVIGQCQDPTQRETQRAFATENQNNDSTVAVKVRDRKHDFDHAGNGGHHEGGHGGDHGVKQEVAPAENNKGVLPVTGAPVSTLAATGAGLLALGILGTIIAVRRRRSASAK
jgi:LPXTG-motif cell wall-anchored protein